MVVFVCGSGKRLLGFEADATDVVELERFGRFNPAEGIHVPNVGNFANLYGRGLGSVLQQIFAAQIERNIVKPAKRGLKLLFGNNDAIGGNNAVAA
jgi:hypothetical protein